MNKINLERAHFTSDNHFGHTTSVRRENNSAWGSNIRTPFKDAGDMDEAMIEGWNLVVDPEDTVHVVGDFVFLGGKATASEHIDYVHEIASQLNGRKILHVGNHDLPFEDIRFSEDYALAGFDKIIMPDQGEENIFELGSRVVQITHFGRTNRVNDYRKFGDQFSEPDIWRLHGHTHATRQMKPMTREYNVAVEAHAYKPVSALDIVAQIDEVEAFRKESF